MTWTSKQPTKAGRYVVRDNHGDVFLERVLMVSGVLRCRGGWRDVRDEHDLIWFGPIPEPPKADAGSEG